MKEELNLKTVHYEDESVVVKKHIKDIEGGRTLGFPTLKPNTKTTDPETSDVTEVTYSLPDIIHSGHVIIKTSNGVYQPLPFKNTKVTPGESSSTPASDVTVYDALPDGAAYVGLLYKYVTKERPSASILTWGIVNPTLLPCAVPAAFLTAVPHIGYEADEEA